jgi:hypothetical protein
MIKLNPVKTLGLALVLTSVLMEGCKDESHNYAEEEVITENAAIGQNEAYDILEIDYQVEAKLLVAKHDTLTDQCVVFLNDRANRLLTLNFGNVAVCTGALQYPLGRTRSGKILVKYSTVIGDTTATRTITFDSYVVNSKAIDGTIEFTPGDTTTTGVTGKLQGICKFTDFKVGFGDGTAATFNGSQTRVWVFGAGDGDHTNDVYTIDGTLTGVSSTDRSFTISMTSTTVANFSCAIPGNFARTSGVLELSALSGYPVEKRTIDYGDSICDKTITITTYRRSYSLSVD